jgi:hypothetical protein
MTILLLFTTISQTKKAATTNKCASVIGHFDGHDGVPVWCRAQTKHVQGYLKSHWTPLLGKHVPRIALADAMVIDFEVKNRFVALSNCCSKASVQKAQNGPSTQLIVSSSCVERSNTTIKDEESSYFSSYQTLTTDKNR